MKHLRLYEELDSDYNNFFKFKIGELVKVKSVIDHEHELKIGDICRVINIDNKYRNIPYLIEVIKTSNKVWVKPFNITKLEEWELDQNKFNL